MHLNGNFVFTLVALFAVMGILSLPPVFLIVTAEIPDAQKRKIALQSTLAIGVTMLVAYAIGQYILELFGIDIEAFRVAGALVVASMAWGMIIAKPSALLAPQKGKNPAVIPLAIPQTAGPGAIATVIALGEAANGEAIVQDVLAILVVTLLAAGAMLGARLLQKWLGDTGLGILIRVFGLLLLAIAITSIMESLLIYFPAWGATGG